MKRNVLLGALFLLTVIVDQITKYSIDAALELYDTIVLIPNILYIRYIRNDGVAWGISLGHPAVMIILTTLIIVLLLVVMMKDRTISGTTVGRLAIVLVLSGAVGNMIDRIRFGEVIDFILMGIGRYTWPVYNFADIYITIGMMLLMYLYLVHPEPETQQDRHAPSQSDASPAGGAGVC